MIETEVAMQLKETYQKIIQLLQAKIDEYGLSFGLLYLIVLIEREPNASQKELSKEMKFTEGAMSSSVRKLLKLNMIKQIPLESDMRYNRLIITKKGKSMIDDYKKHLLKKSKDIFYQFNHEELINLNGSLLRINTNLENMKEESKL